MSVCVQNLKKHKQSYQRCVRRHITQETQEESPNLLTSRWSRLEKWQQTAGLESQTDTARVASEIRLIASSLPEFEWLTSSYQEALDACDDFDDGDTESLFEWTGEFSDKLEESWHRYTGLSVVSSEVTAETAVSHALLLEGIQGWYDAVDMLVQAADGDQDFEPALDRAEEANRLLVAVQKYSDRLHREVQATAK